MSETSSPMPHADQATHVVGIDIGMESCTMCCLARNKQPLIPATSFANTLAGFSTLFARLDDLGVSPEQVLIGLEATSRYGENLFQALLKRGYQVCLLHPAQMHATALAVLKRYPSAQAIAQAPVETLSAFLHEPAIILMTASSINEKALPLFPIINQVVAKPFHTHDLLTIVRRWSIGFPQKHLAPQIGVDAEHAEPSSPAS